jgi:phosphoribosylamine--glycine ligase
MADINRNIIEPTMTGLEKEGLGYAGFLFIGVMVTPRGARTLEYNVRFGDPEAQALLPLLAGDLNEYMRASLEGRLSEITPVWRGGASCCVVMASEGYPGPYKTGLPISGIADAEKTGAGVYCAGVRSNRRESGEHRQLFTGGGRVLGVTALADSLSDARRNAYAAVKCIEFDGGWFRRDIGL